MTSLSIGQVAAYRPLSRCGQEELAIQQIHATPSGGILFARNPAGEEKRAAREVLLDLCSAENMPGQISLLTLPGLKWKFEGALLKRREVDDLKTTDGPARTQFTCIENDRSIYHAALVRAPGMRNPKNIFRVLPSTPFAERAVSCLWIDHFYFGNVDDLMRAPPQQYDVAWLDYTGPMSVQRLALISQFYRTSVTRLLVITAMRARWNRQASDAVEHAGGHTQWLTKALPGEVVHAIDYQDSASPMTQFAVRRLAP